MTKDSCLGNFNELDLDLGALNEGTDENGKRIIVQTTRSAWWLSPALCLLLPLPRFVRASVSSLFIRHGFEARLIFREA
jgi:hypothetical protein